MPGLTFVASVQAAHWVAAQAGAIAVAPRFAARWHAQAAAVVAEDSRAGPQTWIQRIRARIERGDAEGARQSLEGFIERYPRKPLPQDLIDFGQAAGIDDLVRDDE